MEIMKGKRTKRPRQPSPQTLTFASMSSNITENTTIASCSTAIYSVTSPVTSAELIERTEEEEDMANCLILLAQSRDEASPPPPPSVANCHTSYQCKTCDRYFLSFQALGGHMASHKKPKLVDLGERKQFSVNIFEESSEDTDLSLRISSEREISRKSKAHECSICGAEFSSGQALGGHMRRHRPIPITDCNREMKKSRNVLALDLNLPAPEDDHGESRFGFGPKEQVIVFSASSLVDCHY